MQYIATEPAGGYDEGDVVPDDLAKKWEHMYVHPPVKLVGDEKHVEKAASSSEIEEEDGDEESFLDDIADFLDDTAEAVRSKLRDLDLDDEDLAKIEEAEERKTVLREVKKQRGRD